MTPRAGRAAPSLGERDPGTGLREGELEVRGPELFLRYARREDAPALFALASDSEVTRFFSWGPYSHQSEAEAYIRSLSAKRAQGTMLEFVIVHKEAGV